MAISTLLTKIEINPKQILLWDAIGALITVIMLLGVLVPLELYFGMPSNALYFLSAIGLCMFLYSIICYRIINKQWPRFLKIAIVANALYIVMSIGLVIIYAHKLIAVPHP